MGYMVVGFRSKSKIVVKIYQIYFDKSINAPVNAHCPVHNFVYCRLEMEIPCSLGVFCLLNNWACMTVTLIFNQISTLKIRINDFVNMHFGSVETSRSKRCKKCWTLYYDWFPLRSDGAVILYVKSKPIKHIIKTIN